MYMKASVMADVHIKPCCCTLNLVVVNSQCYAKCEIVSTVVLLAYVLLDPLKPRVSLVVYHMIDNYIPP